MMRLLMSRSSLSRVAFDEIIAELFAGDRLVIVDVGHDPAAVIGGRSGPRCRGAADGADEAGVCASARGNRLLRIQ